MNDFLKSIKDDIGDKKFDDLMLINGGATLMFTVDTTGSMKDDIDAAKGIATSIINMPRKFPVDYILSPFNDPGNFYDGLAYNYHVATLQLPCSYHLVTILLAMVTSIKNMIII